MVGKIDELLLYEISSYVYYPPLGSYKWTFTAIDEKKCSDPAIGDNYNRSTWSGSTNRGYSPAGRLESSEFTTSERGLVRTGDYT